MTKRLAFIVSLLTIGLSGAAFAQAGDAPTAKALFAEGIEHADAGRLADALAAFKRAYAQEPHFAVLYNIARIELRLGDEQAAINSLRQYLATGGDLVPPDRRQWAEGTIQSLTPAPDPKPAINRKTASLKIECPWFDFTVVVDGKQIALTPFRGTVVLPAGTRRVQFLREGYVASTRRVRLSADRVTDLKCQPVVVRPISQAARAQISFQLEPTGATATLDGLPIQSGAFVPAGNHSLHVQAAGHEPKTLNILLSPKEHRRISIRLNPTYAPKPSVSIGRHPYRNASALVGTAGLATAASGLAIFLWNDQRYRHWREDGRELRAPGESGKANYNHRVSEHNARLDSIHRYDTATWITLGLGGLLSAAGGVLYFWKESGQMTIALTGDRASWQTAW